MAPQGHRDEPGPSENSRAWSSEEGCLEQAAGKLHAKVKEKLQLKLKGKPKNKLNGKGLQAQYHSLRVGIAKAMAAPKSAARGPKQEAKRDDAVGDGHRPTSRSAHVS